jgi:hypothetical protein
MTEYYKEMLNKGLHYQDFVIEQLYKIGLPIISYSSKEYQNMIGENKAGIEIKLDQKFRDTGNFYIEYAEKSNQNNQYYVDSGILRNDNTWLYLIGDYKTIYVFSKKQLILLLNSNKVKKVETKTSKGILLSKDVSQKYCIKEIIIE